MTLRYGEELAQEGDFLEEVEKEISVVKGNRILSGALLFLAALTRCFDRFTQDIRQN